MIDEQGAIEIGFDGGTELKREHEAAPLGVIDGAGISQGGHASTATGIDEIIAVIVIGGCGLEQGAPCAAAGDGRYHVNEQRVLIGKSPATIAADNVGRDEVVSRADDGSDDSGLGEGGVIGQREAVAGGGAGDDEVGAGGGLTEVGGIVELPQSGQ